MTGERKTGLVLSRDNIGGKFSSSSQEDRLKVSSWEQKGAENGVNIGECSCICQLVTATQWILWVTWKMAGKGTVAQSRIKCNTAMGLLGIEFLS